MKTQITGLAMTFFVFSAIFLVSAGTARASQSQSTQIVFKGAEAKMSLNLFKFQLKNKVSDLNLTPKFVAFEKEINFDIRNMKGKEIAIQLKKAIRQNNNCFIIREFEAGQNRAESEYQECIAHAYSGDTIQSMNKKQYPNMKVRIIAESKLSLAREEMVLEAINADSDTVAILTSLANDVQHEVNFLRPNSSEISVVRADN